MLRIPLDQKQIEAACKFSLRLKEWHRADQALIALRTALPDFDENSCLLKTVALNALYGTQVLAVMRMADHVHRTISANQMAFEIHLVERIADLPPRRDEHPEQIKHRRFTSFAAKFCHFFLDDEQFAIYDEAAREAIRLHLGDDALINDEAHPYFAFCTNLNRLRNEAGITSAGRDLDRYLWITGMYRKWKKHGKEAQLNVELKTVFEKAEGTPNAELEAVLPRVDWTIV